MGVALPLGLLSLLLIASASTAGLPEPLGMNTGPYAGAVAPGEAAVHHYQNAPDGSVCVQIVQPYTVVIESTGPVQVSVWERHGATVDGVGSFTFESGVCTSFDILVEGVGDDLAAYAIEVTANAAGPAVDPGIISCSELC